jgi:osmoprotectant transport system ATP-binding protein
VQFAAPDTMLAHPVDDFVASFVGSDRTLKRLRLIRVREVMAAASGEAPAGRPTVSADEDLRRVATLFLEHGVDELACVGADGRIIGRVTRAAVAARLAGAEAAA